MATGYQIPEAGVAIIIAQQNKLVFDCRIDHTKGIHTITANAFLMCCYFRKITKPTTAARMIMASMIFSWPHMPCFCLQPSSGHISDMIISFSIGDTSKQRRYREAFSAFLTISRARTKILTSALKVAMIHFWKSGGVKQYAKPE